MNLIEKAGAQSADPFTFVLSTEDVDRMGDVVVQDGISLTAFRKNPVALFAHNSRMPIGTWANIRREGNSLLADLKLAARGTSRLIDELRALLEQKILRAASIGFGVLKSEPLDPERPYGGVRYTKTELMEASLVAVPANPNALAVVRSLSPEARALFFAESGHGNEPPAATAGAATAAAQRNAARTGTRHMDISARIKAGKARLGEIDKRLGELKAVAESVEVLTDEHAQEVDALSGERVTVEKNIGNLEKLETAIAARAEPAIPGAPPVVKRDANADKPGIVMVRTALAHVFAAIGRKTVVEAAREHFAHDQRIEAIVKTAVPIADSTTPGWMKELVATDVQGFIDLIQPLSVYAACASRGFVVNFGNFGTVTIPYRAGAHTDLAGAFVGENGVIPVKRGTLAAQTLSRYKMGVITTLTKELSRVSTPQAETLLQRFMTADTAYALDKAFLDSAGTGAAVAGVKPASILNGVAPLAVSVLPTAVDKAIADLKALIAALTAAGNGVRPVFLMNPAQKLSLSLMYSGGVFLFAQDLAQNRVLGVEVVTSLNIPAGEIVLIDAANFATGLGTPEFDTSDTATLVLANADAVLPTHATSAADRTIAGTAEQVPQDGGISVYDGAQHAAGKVGETAQSVSMFQQWGIALRTILPVSWGVVRPGSVQWMQAVTW